MRIKIPMETLGEYFVNSKMCSVIKLQHKHSPERRFSERNFNTALLGAEAHPAVVRLLPLSPRDAAPLDLKTPLSPLPAGMAGSPVSHTLCSKHLSSSFQVSRYSSLPQGRQTLSEVVVHLVDMYVP